MCNSFSHAKYVRLDRIYELDDSDLQTAIDTSHATLENLMVTSCNIRQPNLSKLKSLSRLDFSHCAELIDMKLPTIVPPLVHLVLTGTHVQDEAVSRFAALLPCLKHLTLKSCRLLKRTTIHHALLETLDMSNCPKLSKPVIICPRLISLNCSFTSIKDSTLEQGILRQITMKNLRQLLLSSCTRLKKPRITDTSCQSSSNGSDSSKDIEKSLYGDKATIVPAAVATGTIIGEHGKLETVHLCGCNHLSAETSILFPSSLKFLDVRVTPLGKQTALLQKWLLDNPLLESLRYDTVHDSSFGDLAEESRREIERVLVQ